VTRIGRTSILIGLALSGTATALPAQQSRVIGEETTIPYSVAGAIRQYQVDRADHRIVYMQDARLRWYRVQLSGECLPPDNQATLITRSRGENRIDRWTLIGSSRYPGRLCGIDSIVTALPPAGQPGAAQPER